MYIQHYNATGLAFEQISLEDFVISWPVKLIVLHVSWHLQITDSHYGAVQMECMESAAVSFLL